MTMAYSSRMIVEQSNNVIAVDQSLGNAEIENRQQTDLFFKNSPSYLLEHLATFTVNKESGILLPADGMRRLLQLEKSTGIWSQKMLLCLDDQWVLIIDYETRNVIERFSTSSIKEPTAFTSSDAMELYNNIVIFIVSMGAGTRSEMHIFQSQTVSAVNLVESLKSLGKRKLEISTYNDLNVAKNREKNEKLAKEIFNSYSKRNVEYKSAENINDSRRYYESDSEIGLVNDENSSTSSEIYERDVAVLNHCFDDIEKFIARLQHVAAASRELERRRRNRKSKKKDPGEGLLSLRTRPPHEKEFIDIFSKFKLSFNLLAKLKAHIHDPNAPELVHFLFTPLALIVEAASDTYYESQLSSLVVKPLLTREAINLLINCVTSKETELWRSLGDAWTIPRDQWKENVESYHPVFLDGWSPDFIIEDELKTNSENLRKNNFNSQTLRRHAQQEDTESVNGLSREKYKVSLDDPMCEGDLSFDSIEDSTFETGTHHILHEVNDIEAVNSGINKIHLKDEVFKTSANNIHDFPLDTRGYRSTVKEHSIISWIADLQSSGAKIVQVTYPRTANNDKELTVVRGEVLEILDDSRKWWKARNIHGHIAHVPHTIVAPYKNSHNEPPTDSFLEPRNKPVEKKGEFRYF